MARICKFSTFVGLAIQVSFRLQAQMFTLPEQRPQPTILWDGATLALIENFGRTLKIGDLKRGIFRDIHPLPRTMGISVLNGTTISVRIVAEKLVYSRSDETGLLEESGVENLPDDPHGFPEWLYETDKPNLYFGMNVSSGFFKDGEASCCAWWRKGSDGVMRFEDLIPIEWEGGPAFLPVRQDGKYRYAQSSAFRSGLSPILDTPIRVPGAFVVVSWKAGILWIIKDGFPVPTHTVDLVGIDRDFVLGRHSFPPVILGIQPMKNGHVLIARRSVKAISETYKHFGVDPHGEALRDMEYKTANAEKDAAVVAYPEIEWVDLDPIHATQEKADDFLIAHAPLMLKSYRDTTHFRFGFDTQGRLVIPWVSPNTGALKAPSADDQMGKATISPKSTRIPKPARVNSPPPSPKR